MSRLSSSALSILLILCPAASVAQPAARSDTIVKLAGAPRFPGVARLVEELSIGAENRGPEYLITSATSLLPARDGTLWVLNGGVPGRPTVDLRRYDANGRFLKTVAVEGQGPGELSSLPSALAQLPDGRVLLRENPAGEETIHVYSEQGDFVTDWNWRRAANTSRTNAWLVVDTAGITYTQMLLRNAPGSTVSPFKSLTTRLDRSGKVLDTLPYPDIARWVWSPLGYLVTASFDSYAIELRIPRSAPVGRASGITPIWKDGDPVVSIRRQVAPVPVSAAERRDRDALQASRGPSRSGSPPRAYPATKPPFRSFAVRADGRIWVLTSVPSEQFTPAPVVNSRGVSVPQLGWREPRIYDVFEPNGAYIGRVGEPEGIALFHVRGNVAWGTSRNADDVVTIKRYRINWM